VNGGFDACRLPEGNRSPAGGDLAARRARSDPSWLTDEPRSEDRTNPRRHRRRVTVAPGRLIRIDRRRHPGTRETPEAGDLGQIDRGLPDSLAEIIRGQLELAVTCREHPTHGSQARSTLRVGQTRSCAVAPKLRVPPPAERRFLITDSCVVRCDSFVTIALIARERRQVTLRFGTNILNKT